MPTTLEREPYDYSMCGLPVLLFGVSTPGDTVRIENVHALHRFIAEVVLRSPHVLGKNEIRFLRTQMEMTPEQLDALLPQNARTSHGHFRGNLTDIRFRLFVIERLKLAVTQGELHQILSGCPGPGGMRVNPIRIDATHPDNFRLKKA